MSNKNYVFISIIAASLGCIADVCLLYEPTAIYEQMDYKFLKNIDPTVMLWGHYLGIFAIPFELLGLWVIAQACRNIHTAAPFWIMVALTFTLTIGVAYHSCIIFVAQLLQQTNDAELVIETVKTFFEPLGSLLAIIFFSLTTLFIYGLYVRKILLPRWIVWINPLFIYMLIVLVYIVLPSVGRILLVAGFNLSIAVLLIGVYVFLYSSEKK